MELRDTEFTLEYFVTGMCIDHRFGFNCILQRVEYKWAIQEAVFYGEIKTKADEQLYLDVSPNKMDNAGESLTQKTDWKVGKLLDPERAWL